MVEYDRTIPPGGGGKITLQVDTDGYQGRITKHAIVSSNDHKKRNTRISLSIDVRPHIVVEPARRLLIRGIVGEDVRRVLQIRSNDDQPLEIVSIETNLESLLDYKLDRIGRGHQYQLEVVTKTDGRAVSSGYLKLKTNHPQKKELKLPIYVRIRPEVEVLPNKIDFRHVSRAGTKPRGGQRVLTIINNRGKPFRLTELYYNKEYFKVDRLAPTGGPANRHRLQIVPLLDQLPAGRVKFQETLVIKTDAAHTRELRVPISIRLEAAN